MCLMKSSRSLFQFNGFAKVLKRSDLPIKRAFKKLEN